MAQRYDVSLKSLFLQQGDGIIRRLLFGSRVVEYLSTEQPQIFNHRADMVVRTEDQDLRHIELVSNNESGFPVRMMGYYTYLVRVHNRHVPQVVLYLGREPLRMENFYRSPSIDFRFTIINLRELDAGALAASEDWADNALSILAKGDPFRALETILPRLRQFTGEEQNWAVSTLVLLSGIIGIENGVNDRLKEVGMINVMENKVLGPMILEKIEQGREQGISEGLRQILIEQLIEKFGALPPWAVSRLDNAVSDDFHVWAKRILRASTVEEIFS